MEFALGPYESNDVPSRLKCFSLELYKHQGEEGIRCVSPDKDDLDKSEKRIEPTSRLSSRDVYFLPWQRLIDTHVDLQLMLLSKFEYILDTILHSL